jgi:predicted ATPase
MLRQKQLLLILDNFEHLLVQGTDAIDLVADLIGAAPGVQLLVTSRERLNLRGEHVYAVQALDFSATATLAEAAASAAVRLFVQSVQREQAGFQLTAANLAVVLRICNLVQGMPLGLELAAANAGSLPLSAIADAIEHSAEFLTVDWRITICAAVRSTLATTPAAALVWCRRYRFVRRWASAGANSTVWPRWPGSTFFCMTLRLPRRALPPRSIWRAP